MRVRAVLAITCVLALAGCKLNTDYFKEYRGKNLLASWNFNSMTTGTSPVPKWNLVSDATLAAAEGLGYDPTQYMNWKQIGSGSAPDNTADTGAGTFTVGPDGTSPAYRLEILNLIPDGDFEADSGTSFNQGFWSATDSPNDVSFNNVPGPDLVNNSVPSTISHNTLRFETVGAANDSLTMNLAGAIPTLSFPARNGLYRFHFDFYNASVGGTSLTVSASGAPGSVQWNQTGLQPASSASPLYTLSEDFNPGASPAVTIGSVPTLAYIDNVRAVYTAIDPSVSMVFPSLNSGGLTLLPGTKSGDYVFTVYVHDDPTADQTSLNHIGNRMEPSGITVRFKAAQQPLSTTLEPVFIPRDSSWAGASWKKITVKTGFNFVEKDADIAANGYANALEIYLSPTQLDVNTVNGRDAGSLVIAQPSLVFNP
jgi:hypothetical protein